jgi:hypothetical protein
LNAIFRSVDDYKKRWKSKDGLKLNFHDYHLFEVAAYRLDRLLNLNHIPPVVPRVFKKADFISSRDWNTFGKKEGSVQLWVENAMMEKERDEKGIIPPNGAYWGQQFQLLYLFDNLIYNDDRNQTNILIGNDWKVWFIDSTRAFRPYRQLKHPSLILRCEVGVWERLKELTPEKIKSELGPYLKFTEINTLIHRQQSIVNLLQERIDKAGEEVVLFEVNKQDKPTFVNVEDVELAETSE